MKRVLLATASAGLFAFAGTAQAATVDFGTNFGASLTEGQQITTFDFGAGLTGSLSVTGGTGEALILDSSPAVGDPNTGITNDPDLASPLNDADNVLGPIDFDNVLIIQSNDSGVTAPNDERSGGTITFNFDNLITLDSIYLLDGEEGISLEYVGGPLVGLGGPDNTFDFVTVNSAPISSFTVRFGGSGAIGGFEATVVPLPAGGLLLLTGLGALTIARRRKN